jgi:hypothetical protein
VTADGRCTANAFFGTDYWADRKATEMAKPDKEPIMRTAVRGLVAGALTIGTAILLYATMGPSIPAAILFAAACFGIRILTAHI